MPWPPAGAAAPVSTIESAGVGVRVAKVQNCSTWQPCRQDWKILLQCAEKGRVAAFDYFDFQKITVVSSNMAGEHSERSNGLHHAGGVSEQAFHIVPWHYWQMSACQ
eukprot:218582-Karenia_brevis.AAC.1